FGRDAVSPQGQTACRITIQVSIRSLEYVEIRIDGAAIGGRRNHPQRLEGIVHDAPQPELVGHRNLWVQHARGLRLAVEQRAQPCPETADVHRVDTLQRQVRLESVGHVEMAARAQAYGNWHVGQVLRTTYVR